MQCMLTTIAKAENTATATDTLIILGWKCHRELRIKKDVQGRIKNSAVRTIFLRLS